MILINIFPWLPPYRGPKIGPKQSFLRIVFMAPSGPRVLEKRRSLRLLFLHRLARPFGPCFASFCKQKLARLACRLFLVNYGSSCRPAFPELQLRLHRKLALRACSASFCKQKLACLLAGTSLRSKIVAHNCMKTRN